MAEYDKWSAQYDSVVDKEVTNKSGIIETSYQFVLDQLTKISSQSKLKICDIGCGQGELALRLHKRGAEVTGVDISKNLLDIAQKKTNEIDWICDNAMELPQLSTNSFDVIVSNLMLMDVPEFESVFNSTYRVLKPGGLFICTIMHPCFQSPFSYSLEDGSRNVSTYSSQHWKSNGSGTLRSTLGAYHRPISQYVNKLIDLGYSILQIEEPLTKGSTSTLPSLLGFIAKKPD